MPNIRVIYSNAADRATLTTSTTLVSGFPVTNLASDIKSRVCRSTTTSLSITATFASAEVISGVVLPFCNLSPTATMRVRTLVGGSTTYDSGALLCCPAPAVKLSGYTAAQAASAYGYGGGTYARHWLPTAMAGVTSLIVDIVDTSNAQGYAEVSRLVTGAYWQPAGVGVEEGSATLTVGDNSKSFRNDAGDLMSDVGTRYRRQELTMPDLSTTDRAFMWDILWGNGTSRPILISVFPNNADTRLEQVHMLYGKLVQTPVMSTPYFNRNSATLEVEEI